MCSIVFELKIFIYIYIQCLSLAQLALLPHDWNSGFFPGIERTSQVILQFRGAAGKGEFTILNFSCRAKLY